MGDVLIGSAGAFRLAGALRDVPVKARPRVSRAVRRGGEKVRAEAAANASWSSRIPPAIRLQVRFGGSRAGVSVVVNQAAAPHARPYEGITGGSEFRHPVFGGDVWVAQGTRPFLAPAALRVQGEVVDDIEREIDEAVRASGL